MINNLFKIGWAIVIIGLFIVTCFFPGINGIQLLNNNKTFNSSLDSMVYLQTPDWVSEKRLKSDITRSA